MDVALMISIIIREHSKERLIIVDKVAHRTLSRLLFLDSCYYHGTIFCV